MDRGTAMQGMDTGAARGHALGLEAAATRLLALRGEVLVLTARVTWEGSDADAFRAAAGVGVLDPLADTGASLATAAARLRAEATAQDLTSTGDGAAGSVRAAGPVLAAGPDRTAAPVRAPGVALHLPPLPASVASELIGWGFDRTVDGVARSLDVLGLRSEGVRQFGRDADHLGGVLQDWAVDGEVPTVAELGAALLVTGGSGLVGVGEAVTGVDTPLLDDRPGGRVTEVREVTGPTAAPADLRDLVLANDALRTPNPGALPLPAGRIGVTQLLPADGSDPVYLVQIPPTEGAPILSVDAWGGQGASRDWGSNLRLVAGQDAAAADDVRAAMAAAGVPPGASVMLVGHSQGGILAHHLAADPAVNADSGAPGSYAIEAVVSVGSPARTVVPARASTWAVAVDHGAGISPAGLSGDPIAALDLGGIRMDGTVLDAPGRDEVTLTGHPVTPLRPGDLLRANHDSVPSGAAEGLGYAGTLAVHQDTDPTLRALSARLEGVYLGDGVRVGRSRVVTVGRGEP